MLRGHSLDDCLSCAHRHVLSMLPYALPWPPPTRLPLSVRERGLPVLHREWGGRQVSSAVPCGAAPLLPALAPLRQGQARLGNSGLHLRAAQLCDSVPAGLMYGGFSNSGTVTRLLSTDLLVLLPRFCAPQDFTMYEPLQRMRAWDRQFRVSSHHAAVRAARGRAPSSIGASQPSS